MSSDVFQKFYTSLNDHFNAFIKGIYISLPDGVSSQRIKGDLCYHFGETFHGILTYDPYHGLLNAETKNMDSLSKSRPPSRREQIDFLTLLDRISQQITHNRHRLLVLLDGVDNYLNENLAVLKLAEILSRRSFGYSITLLGFKEFPRYNPLARLNIHEVPYPTPCHESLGAMVQSGLEAIRLEVQGSVTLETLEGQLTDCLFGCPSLALAEDIFNLGYSTEKEFDPASVEKLKLAKVMSLMPGIRIGSPQDLPSFNQVAGFSHLKSYCETRKNIFSRENGEIRLHGICLLGPPGTGKTLFAQALARSWGIPYCSLSMTFLSRFLGSSERNLERILRLLTDFSRPVLFHIDELSRLFGQSQADSHEVTNRILAMLLNFIESPQSKHVYTVGTMNHLDIDPALLRRFDDVFYVGLPDGSSRKELFECFAKKYKLNLLLDGAALNYSRGMVGSEIERTVKDLKIEALSKGTQPFPLDLVRALKKRPPVAELFPDIHRMEEMALRAGFRLASPQSENIALAGYRDGQ